MAEFDRLDVLVNCAGAVIIGTRLDIIRVEQLEKALHFTDASVFELSSSRALRSHICSPIPVPPSLTSDRSPLARRRGASRL